MLLIGMSVVDILLVEKLITKYMEENNIKDPNDVDEKIIQQQYDEIMKKKIWENPSEF